MTYLPLVTEVEGDLDPNAIAPGTRRGHKQPKTKFLAGSASNEGCQKGAVLHSKSM